MTDSPATEARIRAARIGRESSDRASVAEKKARDRLAKPPVAPTEEERRRLWNGYRGSFRAEATEVTNLAKVGREFLLKIGQAPDWTVDLTRPRRSGYRGA